MSEHCVIVGAGHGAAQLCASLRRAKWEGPITLIGDEPFLPYHRPPLSKTKLDPNGDATLQLLRAEDFYQSNDITVMTGERVDSLQADAKQITVNGNTLTYDKLVLCTGSVHRLPPIQGLGDPRVFTLKTAEDAEGIRKVAQTAKRAVIVGAGFIGLEVAASLRKQNIAVTVIEFAPRVLSRVTSPEVSTFFEQLHRKHGVDLRTGASASEIIANDDHLMVTGPNDLEIPCDLVLLGTGAAANSSLAEDAGLTVDNGIRVDAFNQTSDPSIYALGDCCNQYSTLYGESLRLESVQNAVDQAKTVASALTGSPVEHNALPWFWSDQYDVKLQIAGVSTGYDQVVVRGNPVPGESFSAWYFKGNTLLAVDAINDAKAYAVGSKLLKTGKQPDPNIVADLSKETKEILTLAKG